ncbi:MAG: hypothetical protein ACRDTT_10135, partial [Pseudonocardiaceae bacterium]
PLFSVLPGARRKGKLIFLPLMYIGKETLYDTRMFVLGAHITSWTCTRGESSLACNRLGDLAPHDEFRMTVTSDGHPGRLEFVLDVLGDGEHQRKIYVEVPEPTSVPVLTEHPAISDSPLNL